MILTSILILQSLVYRLLIQKIRFDYLVYLKIVVSISKKRNKFIFFYRSRKKTTQMSFKRGFLQVCFKHKLPDKVESITKVFLLYLSHLH